jgi:hypothetical protein
LIPATPIALLAGLVLTENPGCAVAVPARGLVVNAPNITAGVGSTGPFDLKLVNTNLTGRARFGVAADSFGLCLRGLLSAAITVVSNDAIVPDNYVSSRTTQGTKPLWLHTIRNILLTARDSKFGPQVFRIINPGEGIALDHALPAVDSATPNGLDAPVLDRPGARSLPDANSEAIPFSIARGSIRVESLQLWPGDSDPGFDRHVNRHQHLLVAPEKIGNQRAWISEERPGIKVVIRRAYTSFSPQRRFWL